MPISKSDDEHPASHWEKVKDILSEAITRTGCKPQPVWEGGAHDIIQAKILQNIYENPVVVCDLSTRNPNVMLEIGMRLTTKKPTLLIAEEGTPLPFDTGIIQTEFYDPRLEYRTTQAFIENLSGQISDKLNAYQANEYHPYLEAFEFETVEPSRITVSSEERLTELVEKMDAIVARADRARAVSEAAIPNALASFGMRANSDRDVVNALLGFRPKGEEITSDEEIDLLTKHLIDRFEVGDTVYHENLGKGTITDKNGSIFSVDFGNGQGAFVPYAQLRKVG